MIKIVALIIMLPLSVLFVYAQSNDKDEDLIARYAITRYSIQKSISPIDWNNSGSVSEAIEESSELLRRGQFKYSIRNLGKYKNIRIVEITDETNFQLHGLHTELYAIKTNDSRTYFKQITDLNIEEFFSSFLAEHRNTDIPSISAITSLYDETYWACTLPSRQIVVRIDSTNYSRYTFLNQAREGRITSNDLRFGLKVGEDLYWYHYFEILDQETNLADYYKVTYVFGTKTFKVYRNLLLRQKSK